VLVSCSLPCLGRLAGTVFAIRPRLSWATTLYHLLDYTFEASVTNAPLTMSSQSIVSGKAIATAARVRFDPGVYFRMTFEVMLSDEALLAMEALVLAITEMCLNM